MRRLSTSWESRSTPRLIRAYDVVDDGTKIANGRVLITAEADGTPDGFRVDVDGNLWCGWGMGSAALDGCEGVQTRRASRSASSRCPERAANVCFGGPKRKPPVHGGEPQRLFALCEHAGRGRRVRGGASRGRGELKSLSFPSLGSFPPKCRHRVCL